MGITTLCSRSLGEQRKKGGSCEEMGKKQRQLPMLRGAAEARDEQRGSAVQADGEELTRGQGGPNPAFQETGDEEADVGSQPWRLFMERGFPSGDH